MRPHGKTKLGILLNGTEEWMIMLVGGVLHIFPNLRVRRDEGIEIR
jgi:hypothetical protein